MTKTQVQPVRTRIWLEEPEPDDPFATRTAYCHGFDVYGDMLGSSRWVDMLFLLLRGEPPSSHQASLLEMLAVGLANPGPRDPSVHAAMCAGTGGSPAAATLMAALAVGAGQCTGAREVWAAMSRWGAAEQFAPTPQQFLADPADPAAVSVWTATSHPPGFTPHEGCTSSVMRQLLEALAATPGTRFLRALRDRQPELERLSGRGIGPTGIAAAALLDLGFDPEQGEMLFLLLRLPGAMAHALEQARLGHKSFPFYESELLDDPRGTPA